MAVYRLSSKENWSGRMSGEQLYLHEKVICTSPDEVSEGKNQIALLGYGCDEGVRRNHGRIGAKKGPGAIRMALGKMPNHLPQYVNFFDLGDVVCDDQNMEQAQHLLADKVVKLLDYGCFPVLLGGGHDIAFGHYNGIKRYIGDTEKNIGIINFDAHFDLRDTTKGNNSGTPFYQIAQQYSKCEYLCLGIRKDANDRNLFKTSQEIGAEHLLNEAFHIQNFEAVKTQIQSFINTVDYVYATIDLDGFSSAYAPGVSAASPMGFAPDIVLKSLQTIIDSKKMISMDVAEMNPDYDRDGQTAKLAAALIHKIIHSEFLNLVQ